MENQLSPNASLVARFLSFLMAREDFREEFTQWSTDKFQVINSICLMMNDMNVDIRGA